MDKRIGRDLPAEDKMVARFAMERNKSSGKTTRKQKFNLADDDDDDGDMDAMGEMTTLTHFGQAINDIERFEDPRSDDEDDLDNARTDKTGKKLGASYVDEAHFGGFMTKADEDFAEGRGNTRKDWIETIISESKRKKAEKQRNLAETAEMTHDLDQKWKDLWGKVKVGGLLATKADKEAEEKKADPYDSLMKELQFEKGGKVATERVKTMEEKIKDEMERLQKLEKERQKRMKGEVEGDDEDDEDKAQVGEEEDKEEDDDEESGEEEEESEEEGDEGGEDEDDSEEESNGSVIDIISSASSPLHWGTLLVLQSSIVIIITGLAGFL